MAGGKATAILEDDPKKPLLDDEDVEFPSQATVPSFISCMCNGPFRLIVLASSIEALASNMPYVVLPFYARWVIGEDTMDADVLFPIL